MSDKLTFLRVDETVKLLGVEGNKRLAHHPTPS